MEWRPQTIKRLQLTSHGQAEGNNDETTDSSSIPGVGVGDKHLFVETHFMTPQSPFSSVGAAVHPRMPSELPPLYSARPPRALNNNNEKIAATMSKKEKKTRNQVASMQQHQVQERQQQQQYHQQQHFFTTPSSEIPPRIGIGGDDSICDDSVITINTTTLQSVDSRNAPSGKRSIFRPVRDSDTVDTFSEKLLGEMRRVQKALRGSSSSSSVASVSLRSTITQQSREKTKSKNGRLEFLEHEIKNEQQQKRRPGDRGDVNHVGSNGRINERLDYLEQELVREQKERYESEISELKQKLRSMETTADTEIAELKQQLRTMGRAADSEITNLKHQLRNIQREAESEVSELTQQLHTTKQLAESDIADLKQYIRVTDDGYASKSKFMADTHAHELMEMERKYKDAFAGSVAENDLLREEIRIIQEETERKLLLMEVECEDLKNKCDITEQDAELSQRAVRVLESKCQGLVVEKERLERMESNRSAMLDEMTVALEVALAEKDDVSLRYNELRQETENYSDLLADNIQFGRENMELKNELESIIKENEAMRSRLALMDEMAATLEVTLAEKEDVALRCTSLMGEQKVLKIASESVTHALECAIAEKNEVIDRCVDLERENTDLRNASDSASQLTDIMTQQMMDKYIDEIDELKKSNLEILTQRNELKEELICVLETASSLQR